MKPAFFGEINRARFKHLTATLLLLGTTLFSTGQALSQSGSTTTAASSSLDFDRDSPEKVYATKSIYQIYRKNRKIGQHTLQFQRNGNALIVNVESDIKVTVLKVPVFRFNYKAEEIWEDGSLLSVRATVVENGETATNTLDNSTSGARLTGATETLNRETLDYASNHWHPGVTRENEIFNTLTGRASVVELVNAGTETIDLPSGQIEATRFNYSGDIVATSWYDNEGRWVKLRFAGEDGSTIEYRYDANASGK